MSKKKERATLSLPIAKADLRDAEKEFKYWSSVFMYLDTKPVRTEEEEQQHQKSMKEILKWNEEVVACSNLVVNLKIYHESKEKLIREWKEEQAAKNANASGEPPTSESA